MAKNKKYMIMVSGKLVAVSREIYQAYYSMERHTRTLDEKDQRHGLAQYSNLDTPEMLGEEMVPDRDSVSTEDAAVAHILKEKLHQCLKLLPESDLNCWMRFILGGLPSVNCRNVPGFRRALLTITGAGRLSGSKSFFKIFKKIRSKYL